MVTCVDEERQFEQEWIDALKPTLNSYRAHGVDVERVKQWQREYDQRPERKQRQKEHNQNPERKIKHTCDCGGRYTASNKSQHLQTKKHMTHTNQ
jgi:bisphosphoglycerate-dependent phosphoglycerate mutase